MSELPEGWRAVRIEEVCEINPRDRGPADPSVPVSFVPMPMVSDSEGIILEHSTRPFAEVAKGYTRFRNRDVIFAKITPCMENGKIAIADQLHNGMACGSTEFHVLRCSGVILPEYLWRFLRQVSFREEAERHMAGAVGQQRVPPQYLKEAIIPLPLIDEQGRIVAKLDALFARSKAARAELAFVPRLVERAKQAVLAAAFRGDLTAKWRTANPDATISDRMHIENARRNLFTAEEAIKDRYQPPESSPLAMPFLLPDKWLWFRAEAICDFITKGTTPPAASMIIGAGDIPYIKVYNLTFDASLDFEKDPTFIPATTHERGNSSGGRQGYQYRSG